MRKVFGGVLLVVASLLAFQSGSREAVLAQGKKPASTGVVEVAEGKDGKYRFFVRNGEGKLLAMSSPTGFATANDAQKAIDELKEVLARAKVTMAEKKAGKSKK